MATVCKLFDEGEIASRVRELAQEIAAVDQVQDFREQAPWRNRHLGKLERDVPTVPDHLCADLDSSSWATGRWWSSPLPGKP